MQPNPHGPRPAQHQPMHPGQHPPGAPYPQAGAPYPQPGMPPGYQGMPQVPYYPQPKKGFPTWAIVLIVVGVLFFFVIPIMAVAAIPLITSNTRDARRAEGEQMLGAMKDLARVTYSRLGRHQDIQTLTGPVGQGGCGASPFELTGKYYTVEDRVVGNPTHGKLTANPNQGKSDGTGQVEFNWASGQAKYSWSP